MDNEKKTQQCKSGNKAAGLKSTLTVGDKLYLTSFGKGNAATLEQKIDTADQFTVTPMTEEPSIHVTETGTLRVGFTSSRPNVKQKPLVADNPLYQGKEKSTGTRRDILNLKDELEKKFFGMTFDDNLHVQIAYQILDIEKIIAVYATNISAAISHLSDEESDVTQDDLIGHISTKNTYNVFMDPSRNPALNARVCDTINQNRALFEKLLATRRLGYFGFEYEPPKKEEKDKGKLKKSEAQKKRLYHLMAMMGQLRHWCFHGGKEELWLYQLDDMLPPMDREFLVTLDGYFDDRFRKINEHFTDQNKINLAILQELFDKEDFQKVAARYYDFIVVKSYKNMGFSLKKLRETMLTLEGGDRITAQDMDSVRSKLYKLMDFCLYWCYQEMPERVERNVAILRAAITEEEKEQFYADEAAWLWAQFRGMFVGFCDKINGWVEYKVDFHRWDDVIDLDEIRPTNRVSYFAKLLYAATFFLDGKEINDLLTTLINKFDNIASFIATGKELGLSMTFSSDYDFFNRDCARYVAELNLVKNIARMKKPAANAKFTMYCDALRVLGIPGDMSEDEFDDELKRMLKKEIDPKTGKPVKGKNSFRNFIINNVIESNRFVYVIKFCNPVKVRQLVNNAEVTKFVLRRLPETQIVRYYESCMEHPAANATADTMIEALADMMRQMDFGAFRDVEQKPQTPQEAMRKERYKAVIRLYLAVVYQLVKNLVNVNARYVIAIHTLERDAGLYPIKLKSKNPYDSKKKIDDYLALTRNLLAEGDGSRSGYLARNVRMRGLIAGNLAKAEQLLFTEPGKLAKSAVTVYRNYIAHLTAVRSCADYIGDIAKVESYFALYHYLMQRTMAGNDMTARTDPAINPHYAKLDQYRTYVKDFVKELNSPFGYNLPRFKNLSVQELFDRNETQPEPRE